MKKALFNVHFKTGKVQGVWAFCEKEAVILAQANEIKAGHDYDVDFVIIIPDHVKAGK